MNDKELELEKRYCAIYSRQGAPNWSIDIEPAIPFVGDDYHNMPVKCLVFGSAENLTHLGGSREITENNYRRNRQVKAKGNFFKNIHMTPVSDGSLLTAARFILAKKGYDDVFSNNPHDFIEQVSTVNFGKYSIASSTNIDYAGKLKYLKSSFEFVKSDLEILKPDIVVIPQKIYNFSGVRLELFQQDCEVVPIYQTNRLVINSHLKKFESFDEVNRYSFVDPWLDHTIKGMSKYLSWLDRQIVT
ncbi:hypothetical protein MPV89_004471 [Vibrio vulnificus]|uniref:hypothetical protein n=1 Tax=Vibrio vulnificus TaxID=672 RepID=UPI0005F16442|nr:hypothetical protein [Vibrio vulnificus]EHH2451647.1 hypothetical protein [Vibrio vulnificus]EIZ4670232.1 hypothetical protein [Vibrio vulnificus]ELA4932377.1 hypothetical protein [Vibrio vulnificus]MCU8194734.1 hypothetical protein [Vibrio vulnificus]RZQ18799.1 hypothetical protein D8T40_20880 [Vibrio vulnificus]